MKHIVIIFLIVFAIMAFTCIGDHKGEWPNANDFLYLSIGLVSLALALIIDRFRLRKSKKD